MAGIVPAEEQRVEPGPTLACCQCPFAEGRRRWWQLRAVLHCGHPWMRGAVMHDVYQRCADVRQGRAITGDGYAVHCLGWDPAAAAPRWGRP